MNNKRLLPAITFSHLFFSQFASLRNQNQTKKRNNISAIIFLHDDAVLPFRLILLFLIFAALMPISAFAHRVPIDEIDDCRIQVGYEGVHFTAYTPELAPGKEYCKFIPEVGLTNLVFDYEGKKLRNLSVEFEITKEPEGTRIFYQEPKMIKTGTVNGLVDFSKYGSGDYLAHVTLVHKDNKKLDAHLPFKVGFEEKSYAGIIKISIFIFLFLVIFIMIRKAKKLDAKTASSHQDG